MKLPEKLIIAFVIGLLTSEIALLIRDTVKGWGLKDRSDNSQLIMNLGSKNLYKDIRSNQLYLSPSGRLDMGGIEIGDCVEHINSGEMLEVLACSVDNDNIVCVDLQTFEKSTLHRSQLRLVSKNPNKEKYDR